MLRVSCDGKRKLEKSSEAASLLMMRAHQKYRHGAIAQTINRFRQKYSVTFGTKMARKAVRNKCMDSRRCLTITLVQANGKDITRPIILLMPPKVTYGNNFGSCKCSEQEEEKE